MKKLLCFLALGLSALLLTAPVRAGEADVTKVEVRSTSDGVFEFDVTVRHTDEGWEHYVVFFEICAPDGTVLAKRELLHPHEYEQPFTRSVGGVRIPADIKAVVVRARDNRHGYGGKTLRVVLPGREDRLNGMSDPGRLQTSFLR